MKLRKLPVCIFAIAVQLLAGRIVGQTSITTHHYDNDRTGWNSTETVLTPANVWSPNFGLLHAVALDDQVDAQPLVMPDVSITAGSYRGTHNVVYVATEGNSLYAIDAQSGVVLLRVNFGSPVPRTALPGQCGNNGPNVGINSTPVIDPASKTIYVMVYTNDGPNYRLHALDLGSLTDKVTPEVVTASQGLSPSGAFNFNAKYQRQRPALLLANGKIYAGFGSFCDIEPSLSRGWLLGWEESTLRPIAGVELMDSQASDLGSFFLSSIWMSGSGPAADDDGNILFVTGNSDYQADTYDGITNLQESVVKVSPGLDQVVDLFTPSNQWSLDQEDGDFGSGGVMLVPEQPGSTTPLAVAAGKDGRMYLMNEASLGRFSPTTNAVLGTYEIGNCWCSESFFTDPSDGLGRIVSSGGSANQLEIWRLQTTPAVGLNRISTFSLGSSLQRPGFFTSVSSDGTAHPIVWAVSRPTNASLPKVTLSAFDPESGGTILTRLIDLPAGTWPNLGGNANLVPVVANGRVYVASDQQLRIFGLTGNDVRVEATATKAASVRCSASPQSPWTDLSAVRSPGTAFASSSISVAASGDVDSQCLNATGFNFSIPANAEILGIEVSSIDHASETSMPVTFTAQLLYNGKAAGTARTYTTQNSSPLRFAVGTPSNRWGTTLTATEINQSSFGVSIRASLDTSSAAAEEVLVDDVQITVFYAPQVPSERPPSCDREPEQTRDTCYPIESRPVDLVP